MSSAVLVGGVCRAESSRSFLRAAVTSVLMYLCSCYPSRGRVGICVPASRGGGPPATGRRERGAVDVGKGGPLFLRRAAGGRELQHVVGGPRLGRGPRLDPEPRRAGNGVECAHLRWLDGVVSELQEHALQMHHDGLEGGGVHEAVDPGFFPEENSKLKHEN